MQARQPACWQSGMRRCACGNQLRDNSASFSLRELRTGRMRPEVGSSAAPLRGAAKCQRHWLALGGRSSLAEQARTIRARHVVGAVWYEAPVTRAFIFLFAQPSESGQKMGGFWPQLRDASRAERGRVIVKCAACANRQNRTSDSISACAQNNLGCRVATSSAASHIGGLRRSVDIGKAACVLHAWQATAMVKGARDTRFPDVSAGRNSTLR